jgi:hypothetical protein
MRCVYSNVARENDGDIINDATITVYLAGSSTLASIYNTFSGTTATNSVTTNSSGEFTFYVDRFDYDSEQRFKYTVAKTGHTTRTYDNIDIDRVVITTYAGDKTLTTNLIVPKGVLYSGAITVTTGAIQAGYYPIFTGSGTVTGLSEVIPQWFGAVGDQVTNDSTAFQKAIDAVLTNSTGGTVYVPTGKYYLGSKLSVINSNTKGFKIYGDGEYNTILYFDSTIAGDLITWTCTGPSTEITDMMISTNSTGDAGTTRGLNILGSNGVFAHNLWISACQRGLYVSANSSHNRFSDIVSELNTYNFSLSQTDMNTFNNMISYRANSVGFHLTGTPTLTIAGTAQGNVFSNISSHEDGYGGDGAGGGFYNESIVPVAINNIAINSYGSVFPYTGIYTAPGSSFVTVTNPVITGASRYGIRHTAGELFINGGRIEKTGYYNQTVPWATFGIYAGSNATILSVNKTKVNSEGNGIHSLASNTILDGIYVANCSDGGSTGSVNATTGVYAVYYDPQGTTSHFKMINSHFYNDVSAVGKTGLYIAATATPAAHNIKLIGNSVNLGGFATNFASALSNANLLTYDYYGNHNLLATEASGTGTVANAATTSVITHGLGLTPLAEHISIMGKEAPSNAIGVPWISTITSTQFTVNIADPGASNWDFGWRVSIK